MHSKKINKIYEYRSQINRYTMSKSKEFERREDWKKDRVNKKRREKYFAKMRKNYKWLEQANERASEWVSVRKK